MGRQRQQRLFERSSAVIENLAIAKSASGAQDTENIADILGPKTELGEDRIRNPIRVIAQDARSPVAFGAQAAIQLVKEAPTHEALHLIVADGLNELHVFPVALTIAHSIKVALGQEDVGSPYQTAKPVKTLQIQETSAS
jgi:3-oxoacyl-[acyl-carrier-protein] synthase III